VPKEPEHQMLFDLRGRRKRVIQVIYVLLAVIMAASLLVIGLPGGVNPFGNVSQNNDIAQISIDRAENLETRLLAEPNNQNVKAELIRARVSAGGSLIEVAENGQQIVGDEAKAQYDLAAQAWSEYLRATDNKPDPSVAQLMSTTLFSLAQGSTVSQFQVNIEDAAQAQQLVVESARQQFKKGEGPAPTPSLVVLATYLYYAQDAEAADRARQEALASTRDDAEREDLKTQLDAAEQEGTRIGRIIRQAERQARNTGGQSLEDPLGNLGTPAPAPGGATQP